jgi:hypothetical protein
MLQALNEILQDLNADKIDDLDELNDEECEQDEDCDDEYCVDNVPEGYVNCNGVIAYYVHGEVSSDRFYGRVTNLKNAGMIPEGDSIDEYKKDVWFMVDWLFEDFDRYGKPLKEFNAAGGRRKPIEFYVHDPVILNFFYNRYPHKKVPHKTYVVPLNPRYEEQEVPFRMAA